MDFADIIYEKKDRVATVTMNRPDKMNAWTPKMGVEMRTAMLDAERDPTIGAIIVTGAGRAYCAGADMDCAVEYRGRSRAERARAEAPDEWLASQRADYRTSYSWPLALNTPVIGAINGACVGLGLHDLSSTRTFGSRRTRREWDSSSRSAGLRSNTAAVGCCRESSA